jgi:hypothetical protein
MTSMLVGWIVPTTTATAATTTSATATSPAATSTAATVAGHLVKARIDLLLGLCKDLDEVTGLLRVWSNVSEASTG